jgi:probable rRNA maturation factor
MNIVCEVEDPRWDRLSGAEKAAARCVALVLGDDPRTVNVLLTSDAEVRLLNRRFRGKDQATNVLAFPAAPRMQNDGGADHLGDIALAFETVEQEAAEQGKPLLHHASHLIVHGCLHLLGYGHDSEQAADAMERHERNLLASLGIPDPYLT